MKAAMRAETKATPKSNLRKTAAATGPEKSEARLKKLRASIDRADDQLLKALAKRTKISQRIGELKDELGLPPLQPARWRALKVDRQSRAITLGLNPKWIGKIWDLLHEESLRIQGSKK